MKRRGFLATSIAAVTLGGLPIKHKRLKKVLVDVRWDKQSRLYYDSVFVDYEGGSDRKGNGTVNEPFKTIKHAFNPKLCQKIYLKDNNKTLSGSI